ncbi:MAG: aldolase/citrate lyase family protein [Bacteroidota bacterium]
MNNLRNFDNKIMEKMRKGTPSIGVFLLSGSAFIAEAMAQHPIDWMLIDMEASHATKADLMHILQALNGYSVTPLIRISYQNKHLIESGLDFGAKGVMIPKVDNRQQGEDMVSACFYPPKGNRGINCIRASGYYLNAAAYLRQINSAVITIVQIESKESIENLEDIAGIPELDILFIGLGDLAASYGQIGSVSGKFMDEAREKVLQVCKKHHKIPGIFAHSIEVAQQYLEEGFLFLAIGNDIKFLHHGLADELRNTLGR